MIVGYVDNVLTARAFATRNGYRIDANQELLALGMSNLAVGRHPGLPGEQQRQPHRDRRRPRQPQPAALPRRPGTVVLALLFLRPALAAFPTAALGAIVVYAALRLIDLARVPPVRGLPAQRAAARPGDPGVGAGLRRAHRRAGRRRALHRRAPAPGGPPARRHPRLRARDRRDARHRRLSRGAAGAGAGRLPLRLAAVLRQRGGLPDPRARRGRDGAGAGRVVRAQRGVQRRGRPHRAGRRRGTARRADRAGDRVRDGPGQAGPARRPAGRGAGRPGGRRTHLPTLPTAVQAYVAWYPRQARRAAHGCCDRRRGSRHFRSGCRPGRLAPCDGSTCCAGSRSSTRPGTSPRSTG